MAVFGDLNEVKLIGNITNDIEVRNTPSGTPVTNFGLATNRNYKAGEEWKEEVTFHDIVVWGRDAEYLSQRAKKGTKVFVSGRLQKRSWEDQEGKKNYKVEIVAEKVILLDRYERGSNEGYSAPTSSQTTSSGGGGDTIDPDDLPF